MAEQTTNLHLKKPEYADSADVKDFNDNMDTIDGAVKQAQDDIDAIEGWQPTGNGTLDQILRSNGDGTTRWDEAATQQEIGSAVTTWLDDNIDQASTAAIDDTLSVAHAAAEAKVTGDKLTELKSAISDGFEVSVTWKENKIVNSNGAYQDVAESTTKYYASDDIDVSVFGKLRFIGIFSYAFLNSSGTVIDVGSSDPVYTLKQWDIDVPQNAKYIRYTKETKSNSYDSALLGFIPASTIKAIKTQSDINDTDINKLFSWLENSTLNAQSSKTVQVSSLSRINYWLKEIPPTTAASSSAYSVKYDVEAYRGGRVLIHSSVMANNAADPKYSWAIADSSNNVLASSAKNNSAQTINDTFVIPNTAKTLWIGTDTTNSSSAYFTLTNTTANTVDEKYAQELNKDILLVVPFDANTDKNWLTTIPPTSSGYSTYALDKGFDISEYVGRKVNIVVKIMGTGSGTDKYAWAIADASNNILISSTKTTASQDIDITVTIPTGAKMLWLSTDTTNQKAEATIKANAVKELEKDVSELQERFPVPTYPIICWGDSLTAGAGWIGTPSGYPVVLSEEFGVEVKNAGVGGETSSTIAARMGAIPVIVPAGDINGTYATDAFKDQWGNPVQPLKQDSADYKKTVNPIVINGEEASLAINTSTNEYTISGYSGDASAVPVEMTFYGQNLTGIITVICVGQNDTGIALEQIMARIDSMIDHCSGEWLVLGRPTGDAESRATEEAAMLNKYGGRYLNSRNVVSQYGMTIMGLTPTSEDTAAIATGAIPPSLLYDTVHLNENGYRAWGKFIAMRIRALGFDKLL